MTCNDNIKKILEFEKLDRSKGEDKNMIFLLIKEALFFKPVRNLGNLRIRSLELIDMALWQI